MLCADLIAILNKLGQFNNELIKPDFQGIVSLWCKPLHLQEEELIFDWFSNLQY